MKIVVRIIYLILVCIMLCSCQGLIDNFEKSTDEKKQEESVMTTSEPIKSSYLKPLVGTASESLDLSGIEIGDSVFFGEYEQDNVKENGKESIEWIVLDKTSEYALLLCRYALDYKPFFEEEEHDYSTTQIWRYSYLSEWLNYTFMEKAFDDVEENSICDTIVEISPKEDRCHIFVLSVDDLTNTSYNGFDCSPDSIDKKRLCEPTVYALQSSIEWDGKQYDKVKENGNDGYYVDYWTRSRGKNNQARNHHNYRFAYVEDDGTINSDGSLESEWYFVRPAMFVKILS